MKRITTTALALTAAAGLFAGHATAATMLNATGITANGESTTTMTASASRKTPGNALGAADGSFYSIGLGGVVDFVFGSAFRAMGQVVEVTYKRTGYFESADIFGGDGMGTFTFLASVSNQGPEGNQLAVPFSASGIYSVLRFVDTSVDKKGRDGFDIDSVSVAPVPVPAAGFLLVGALGALGLRRRKA